MSIVEPGRLKRALFLDVVSRGADEWEVTGGREPHVVTERHGRLSCDCIDHRIRGTGCKHVLAVKVAETPPPILDGLRHLVQPEGLAI